MKHIFLHTAASFQSYNLLHHTIQQRFEIIYVLIDDIAAIELLKQLLRAGDFLLRALTIHRENRRMNPLQNLRRRAPRERRSRRDASDEIIRHRTY